MDGSRDRLFDSPVAVVPAPLVLTVSLLRCPFVSSSVCVFVCYVCFAHVAFLSGVLHCVCCFLMRMDFLMGSFHFLSGAHFDFGHNRSFIFVNAFYRGFPLIFRGVFFFACNHSNRQLRGAGVFG